MASFDVDKEDILLQQQTCDLGKVKLEPCEYYTPLEYDDTEFIDWDLDYIDISSSSDASGKSISGAEIGEEAASLYTHRQSSKSLENLRDSIANGISHKSQQQRSTEQLANHNEFGSRISYANSPIERQESTELPVDFLQRILSERDIGSPLFLLPSLQPSSNGTRRAYRASSRQFWKAGDYESDCITDKMVVGGMDHIRVHPKFLHSNATSHKWVLGAVAELLDNALDEAVNGASFVHVDMIRNPRDGSPMLLIEDDGGGMNPDCMRQCMSLGYSAKSKVANTIGQYGNGFKTSTMRLGADVIVFSLSPGRDSCSATKCIGLLSYSFLTGTCQDDIMVPMVDYEIQPFGLRKLIRGNVEDWNNSMEIITQWSPYISEADLLEQFKGMELQGTRIVVYNLWEDDQGQLELDFDADPHDIQVRGANRVAWNILVAERLPNSRHYVTYKHSLRSYASVLYLRLPKNFKIILRGKQVEHHNLVDDLMFIQEVTYRPQVGPEYTVKEASQMKVVVTIGFVKDAREHLDVQGFNVYHKNRLIKPFWRIWNSAASRGRGIIGVLEANFVEPAHDKQGFERTIVLARLESRLLEMQKAYWAKHCHRVGYMNNSARKNRKHTFRNVKDTENANSGPPHTQSQPELSVPSFASLSMLLRSQSHGALQGISQASEQCDLPITSSALTFTSSMQPQTYITRLKARQEMGAQSPSVSSAFSVALHTQVQEAVSTSLQAASLPSSSTRPLQETASGALQAPSASIALVSSHQVSIFPVMLTSSPRCQTDKESFTLQGRSEAEVSMLHFPLSSAIRIQSSISEACQIPQLTRLEPEVEASPFLSVTRSIQFPAEEVAQDSLQGRIDLDISSVSSRLLHTEVHDGDSEVPSLPISVVSRGMRSQLQRVPARAFMTDAISLTTSTMQDTVVTSSNRSNSRENLAVSRMPPSTMQERVVASLRTNIAQKLSAQNTFPSTMQETAVASLRTTKKQDSSALRIPPSTRQEETAKEKLAIRRASSNITQKTTVTPFKATPRENLIPTPPSTVQEKVKFSLRIPPRDVAATRTPASTMEETPVASLCTDSRQELPVVETHTTRPEVVESLIIEASGKGSNVQDREPAIKRKSLEDLGRMFAKKLVTAERTRNVVDPIGTTDLHSRFPDENHQVEIATGTNGQHYEDDQASPQDNSNMLAGNSDDSNAQGQSMELEAEKNQQLRARLTDLEKELQMLEVRISNLENERDSLKLQLEEERKKGEADMRQLQIELQDAIVQIRKLEVENGRLRSFQQ